ncbi:hypothetical protein D3C85_1216180 [compost metagenome]
MPQGRDLAPGGGLEQVLAPASPGDGDGAAHQRMQAGNIGKAFFRQPADRQLRAVACQIGQCRPGVDKVAHRRCAQQQDVFHAPDFTGSPVVNQVKSGLPLCG